MQALSLWDESVEWPGVARGLVLGDLQQGRSYALFPTFRQIPASSGAVPVGLLQDIGHCRVVKAIRAVSRAPSPLAQCVDQTLFADLSDRYCAYSALQSDPLLARLREVP
jgi:hypothetical protein